MLTTSCLPCTLSHLADRLLLIASWLLTCYCIAFLLPVALPLLVLIDWQQQLETQLASDPPSHSTRDSIQQRSMATEGDESFPCSNCDRVFGRKAHLKRHMDSNVCTGVNKIGPGAPGGVLEGGDRSNFNLRRRMARAVVPFMEYTRAFVTLQSQYDSGPVDFIPLGGECVPRDVWALAKCIEAAMDREGVLPSSPRVVAACAIVSLGLTDRWALMVDLPPADPTDPHYFKDLKAKLLLEWALQRPVFNTNVLAANCNSILRIDSRKLASQRISVFMEKVHGISTRAPAAAAHLRSGHLNDAMEALHGDGIPMDGYIMKMTLSLWCALGMCTGIDFSIINYPMGSAPLAALSHFIGQKICDMPFARRCLCWLKALILHDWEINQPVVTLPVFNELQLQAVLCTWWSSGRPVSPVATTFATMKATLLVQPAGDH